MSARKPTYKANRNSASVNVLIVDDEEACREVYEFVLEKNYRVFTAVNGKEAWKICHNSNIDIVLLDVVLPDVCGADLCRMLKQDENTSSIKVVLMSSYNWPDGKHPKDTSNCDLYLEKPLHVKQLEQSFENILEDLIRSRAEKS